MLRRGQRNLQERVNVGLSRDELGFLCSGVAYWDGPVHATDALARVMGFASRDDMVEDIYRLHDELAAGSELSRRDWTRALLALEIAFASDVAGDPSCWPTVTSYGDAESFALLRRIQTKLEAVIVNQERIEIPPYG